MSLSVAAQSIDNIDQIPAADKGQYFNFIDSLGTNGTLNDLNAKYAQATAQLGGDAVIVVTKTPVYDDFAEDFYTKNNFNPDCGIIILINRTKRTNKIQLFGKLKGKEDWATKRFKECYDYETVETLGDFYKVLADSLCAIIGDVNIAPPQQQATDETASRHTSLADHWEKYEIAKRTKSDPKVHKQFLKNQLTLEQQRLALMTPYVDTAQKIYDAARLLSKDEISKLQASVRNFINKYNTDMAIVTINQNNKQASDGNIATENYAMDFYEYNDFGKGEQTKDGYDGVILVIDMQNRKFSILDVGTPNNKYKIAKNNVDKYISRMSHDLTMTRYYDAINNFIESYSEDCDYFFNLKPDNWNKYLAAPRTDGNPIPLVDTSIKIYDAAGILSRIEIQKIRTRAREFISKNKLDLVIVTINQNDCKPGDFHNATIAFANEFYNQNHFVTSRRGGVMFLIDNLNRTFAIKDFGEACTKWNIASGNRGKYNSEMSWKIPNKDYYNAIIWFIDTYEADYKDKTSFPWEKCLGYSLLIALVALYKERKKYKSIYAATTAYEYSTSFKFNVKNDTLIGEHTTRTYNPRVRESSSSGGGYSHSSGSSHRSSSGRSFGGGSGSF